MSRLNTYLKRNDQVIVTAGKEKGKIGKVLQLLPEKSRVLIEKINLVKIHQKPTASNRQGGIVEKESGIHISNVMLYCPKCKKGVRISQKISDNNKTRVCKKCNEAFAA